MEGVALRRPLARPLQPALAEKWVAWIRYRHIRETDLGIRKWWYGLMFDPEKEERMRAFQESGIIATKTYLDALKWVGGLAGLFMAVGISGCLAYSPSHQLPAFLWSVLISAVGTSVMLLTYLKYRRHRQAVGRQ